MSPNLSVFFGCALIVNGWFYGSGQTTNAAAQSETNAPTGTYSTTSLVEIKLHIRTNGIYEAQCDRGTQRGRWTWDSKQRELQLTPATGEFPYSLRRLRVDKREPDCLQWLPFSRGRGFSWEGALDYVRFRHQKE